MRAARRKRKEPKALGVWAPRSRTLFRCLLEYVEREGHTCVPAGHKEGNFRLGAWVQHRRQDYELGRLSGERVRVLKSLPGWTWRLKTLRQQHAFGRVAAVLRGFVKREGHACVPQHHVEDGFPLGQWVSRRRGEYKKGHLSAKQVGELETLPGWSWDVRRAGFEEGLEHLRCFVKREGHARVPAGHEEGNFQLGVWVQHRRQDYRQGRLDPALVHALGALPGWSWDVRRAGFEEGLEHLRRFVKREGHARVPVGHMEGNFRLGAWVSSRRQDYRQGRLEPALVHALERVPGCSWSPFDDDFKEGLQLLRRFVKREGHARVPQAHRDGGFALGRWVQTKRTAYKEGRLERRRIRALEGVAGWSWSQLDDNFEEGLGVLRRFVKREGHARVPVGHMEGNFRLGAWVSSRRQAYRRGGLSPERICVLEGVAGWSWSPFDDDFEEGLQFLRRFVKREGHARVPAEHREGHFALGVWVGSRRGQWKTGRLSAARARALEKVPGWSWRVGR